MKYAILENIRSAHNVGSIFRTADGAGVSKIFLVGCTPAPVDRFGRIQPEIFKTSLGATQSIDWEQFEHVVEVIGMLRANGVSVVSVEQSPMSIPFMKFSVPPKVAYIFGNEVSGVSDDGLSASDQIIEIPMMGTKESLNVSVTVGIVLYH